MRTTTLDRSSPQHTIHLSTITAHQPLAKQEISSKTEWRWWWWWGCATHLGGAAVGPSFWVGVQIEYNVNRKGALQLNEVLFLSLKLTFKRQQAARLTAFTIRVRAKIIIVAVWWPPPPLGKVWSCVSWIICFFKFSKDLGIIIIHLMHWNISTRAAHYRQIYTILSPTYRSVHSEDLNIAIHKKVKQQLRYFRNSRAAWDGLCSFSLWVWMVAMMMILKYLRYTHTDTRKSHTWRRLRRLKVFLSFMANSIEWRSFQCLSCCCCCQPLLVVCSTRTTKTVEVKYAAAVQEVNE